MFMETEDKKPQSIQALSSELETIELSTANTKMEDASENENQSDLAWQVEDVDADAEDGDVTQSQTDTHQPVSDSEIEVLKNRAKLAGNAVRHQVQEARAHSFLARLWQKLVLESKPDMDGKFHPARWKIGLWLGVPACLGFALVLATVLAPTAIAKKPCLPSEPVAADGSSPCEPVASANMINTADATGQTAQSAAQTPETAVVDAPTLPKSTMNGDPVPNPEPTPTPTMPLRPQTEEVAPSATPEAPSATALGSGATLSSPGGTMDRTYSATNGEAPYLAAQAITPVPTTTTRNRVQPAQAKTYVLSKQRQSRAVTFTFKPSPTTATVRSRMLSSASESPASITNVSSTVASTDAPRTPVTTADAGRVEGGTASQAQLQRTVLLSAPASSEPVGSRGQAVAGDARATETQTRSANVAGDARASQTQTRSSSVGGNNSPATPPARTVTLGSSQNQNAPGSNAPGGDVAQAGLGQDTYPIGSQVQAKLRFGFLAVEGHDDIPVVAESADGSVWLGWASINKESRVEILFREVYIKGKAYLTGAQAYNLEKLPGLNGTARYEAPNLVADLLQAAVGGISTYVNDLTQRGTTTTSGSSVTTSRNTGPTLGQTVLGRAANLFDIGRDTRALIRLVEVPADTPFLVIVLPKR
jgi:hypothetical protein